MKWDIMDCRDLKFQDDLIIPEEKEIEDKFNYTDDNLQ